MKTYHIYKQSKDLKTEMQDLFYQDSDYTGDVQNSKMKVRLKDETSVLIILINKSSRCHWYSEWEEMFFVTPTKGSLPNIPGPRELPAFITTFITPWGLYKCVRVPIGLSNAPAELQRYMENFLIDIRDKFAFSYLNDVQVYSDDFDSYVNHLLRY